MKYEKKSKLKKLIPIISSTTLLAAATAFLSGSCKQKEKENKTEQPNYQPSINGPIKYLSIGDQYSTQYNQNTGAYFDEKSNNIYGLSYSSYLANYMKLLSSDKTYLKSYYNLGLDNSTLDEWLHLLNPEKYKINDNIRKNFEFNKKINDGTLIENEEKNKLFYNNFQQNKNKYHFIDKSIKEANLLTMSLGINDFLDNNEFLDIIWKLTYANLTKEEAKKYFDKIFKKIISKQDQIIKKFNELIKTIREKNKVVNINLVGYITPFLKFSKLIENKYTVNYLQIITDIINETLKKVAKNHKINYLNFENEKDIMDNSSKLTDGFLNSSLNLSAHKKLAQDMIMKMSLSDNDYESLIGKKQKNIVNKNIEKYISKINGTKNNNKISYDFYKSLNFDTKPGIIKNTILGLLGNNVDTYKKEFEFEQLLHNQNIIQNNKKFKYNIDFLKSYKYIFNDGKNFSNKEIVDFLKNSLNYFGLDNKKFENIINFISKSLNNEIEKNKIIDLINTILDNKTINDLINRVNYSVDEIFKNNHSDNINTEEIFNLIVKTFSSSNAIFNIFKELFLSKFFEKNINDSWTLELLNLFSKDILKSNLLPKLFGNKIAQIITKSIDDKEFFDSLLDYLNNMFKTIITDRDILLNSKYFYEFSEKIILKIKDKFNILIIKFIKVIQKDKQILDYITSSVYEPLSKLYNIDEKDEETIKYTIHNLLKNLDKFEKKTELMIEIINSYLKLENTKENFTSEDYLKYLINKIINPSAASSNKNHSLLFNIMSYLPNASNINSIKYLNGLKKLSEYHINSKLKLINFSDNVFVNNFLSLVKDILKNDDNNLNDNGKEVILHTIKYITNNIVDTKGLFYEIIKNISEYTILRPIINLIHKNNLEEIILKANPNFKSIDEFVDATFLEVYKILGSSNFKSSILNLFEHIINNSNSYKFEKYEDFILNILRNGNENGIKNIFSSIFEEISKNINILPNAYSIFFAWFENETKISMSEHQKASLKNYITNFIKNIPNSNLYNDFFDLIVKSSKSIPNDSIDIKKIAKLYKDIIYDFLDPNKNKKLVQYIFELVILKPKNKDPLLSFKEIVKTYKILLNEPKFISYILNKFDIKNVLIKLINKINIDNYQLDEKLKSKIIKAISDFSKYVEKNWETLFETNIKQIINDIFSDDVVDSSNSIEEFISKSLLKSKPVVLNILKELFNNFIFNPLDNKSETLSEFLIELVISNNKNIKINNSQKELICKTIEKILNEVNDKKIYESIVSELIDVFANNITKCGFDFNKYNLNILSILLKNNISIDKISSFIKNNLESNEIKNIFEILLSNAIYLIDKLKQPGNNSSLNISNDNWYTSLFNLIKTIFEKMNNEDRHYIVNKYASELKEILLNEKIINLINNQLVKQFKKLNNELINEFLNISGKNSLESLIMNIFTSVWTEIINQKNIDLTKNLINHIIDNYSLYNSNSFQELFISILKNNKLNNLNELFNNLIKSITKNGELSHSISNLFISALNKYTNANFSKLELNKIYLYINSLFKNLTNSKLFEKYFNLISDNLSTKSQDINNINDLKKSMLSWSLELLTSEENHEEIFNLFMVKNEMNQYLYNFSEVLNILKIIISKSNVVDWLLNKINLKNIISNSLKNIDVDPLKYNEKCQNELKEIFNLLSKFITNNYDEEIKPTIKKLTEILFDDDSINKVNNYKDWISLFIKNSNSLISKKMNQIISSLINKNEYEINEKLSSLLVELLENNIANINWTLEQKNILKSSILKLIKYLPKFNILEKTIESIIKRVESNIAKNEFNFKKYSFAETLNLIEIINNLNFDEILEYINSIDSQEIRNILLIILENLPKSSLENKSSLIFTKGKITNLNNIFNVFKALLGALNKDDKLIIKEKLPKILKWLRSNNNIQKSIKNLLENLRKIINKDNPIENEFIDLVIEKILSIFNEHESFEELFNSIIFSILSIEKNELNKLKTFNDLFSSLLKMNSDKIKDFLNTNMKNLVEDNNFINKSLDFIFNKLIEKYKLDTNSSEIENIKSLLKRTMDKIIKLDLIKDVCNAFVDSLPSIKILNPNNEINKDIAKEIFDILKNINYSKFLTENIFSELIEAILNKNLPISQIENEILSLYKFIRNNFNKFIKKEENNNAQKAKEEFLKNLEKLIFNLLSAANGSIKPDNNNGKEAIINFLHNLSKNEIEKIDLSSLNIQNISSEKLKWILKKVSEYPEIRSLIEAFVNDYLSGTKIIADNLGQMISKIINLISVNLTNNITNIINKFSKDDEVLLEIVKQLFNYLNLENIDDSDELFAKNLISEIIPELLKTDIYKRKILNRLVKQLSKHANDFDILNPNLWLKEAIKEFKSALSFRDSLVMSTLIGEDKVINGEKLVKLINLILGKSKNPDSLLYNLLRNINMDKDLSKRTNMKTLNDMISNSIFNSPKPIGDENDPDNILAPFDPLTIIDTIFKLLGKEIDNEANKNPNFYNSYKIRSKTEPYKATYRFLVSMQLALFEMFGRETLMSERDNVAWYQLTKVSLYSGRRSLLWEIQEGTNLKSIPFIANKFSGMQKYFTNEKIRKEFTNYVQKQKGNKYHYYNEDNYGPDSITYLLVSSGYNEKENHLLKPFKYKVSENGEINSISKKDYILMTIKEGGFGKFMKLNNINSSCEWSHLNENTEWE